VLGAGVLSVLAYAAIHGSSQMTRPRRSIPELTPDSLGRAWEPTCFHSPDGVDISAWLIPHPTARAAVILCHGFGGHKGSMLPLAEFLAPHYNVLLLDVRGHGESGGAWTSIGHFERLDVIAAAEELRRLSLGPIGALGISMGASTVLLAAADSAEIDAVVADSPFAVLRRAVTGSARLRGYPPGIAEVAALAACRAAALRLGHAPSACDPVRAIGRIAPRPVFLIHGEQDRLIPVTESRALFAASNDPCTLWTIPNLAHAVAMDECPDDYSARVLEFFAEHLNG
jgi:alpha-beta hydrolase superfamily lysophospholipase